MLLSLYGKIIYQKELCPGGGIRANEVTLVELRGVQGVQSGGKHFTRDIDLARRFREVDPS